MTHAVQKWGRSQVDAQMGWNLFLVEGLCYITGALLHAVSNCNQGLTFFIDLNFS
jgi:hypothetical protein